MFGACKPLESIYTPMFKEESTKYKPDSTTCEKLEFLSRTDILVEISSIFVSF